MRTISWKAAIYGEVESLKLGERWPTRRIRKPVVMMGRRRANLIHVLAYEPSGREEKWHFFEGL